MNCPNCQQENPRDANYCRNCGWLLAATCPRCQTRIIPASHYCHHCGLPLSPQGQTAWWQEPAPSHFANYQPSARDQQPAILAGISPAPDSLPSPAAPQDQSALDRFLPRALADKLQAARSAGAMVGERRVVTMLFCDVKGSTAAAETLDPEEWTDIINGAFEHMIKPVYKYEGIVARLMGDAILAFFGAPIAHEDDPQRAVLTGLEIVALFKEYQEQILARYGLGITVRVGINTGLVVVGAVGSDLRMEYTAMGDAINLAARMEQTAEPGTVQIAEPTYLLVKPLFDFAELGGVEVKGKAEPVLSYRVLRRKVGEQNLRGIENMRAPLIGRDREINTLHQILDSSQQRLGHIVCLTGDAGLGKSRLIEEAHEYWQSAGLSGSWHMVSSLSYETNHAYGLFQRLIRRLDQIAVSDSPAIVREKLQPALAYFPEERRPRVMQLFETMFALESESNLPRIEGETFKEELFNALLHIWSHRFADQPAVLVFDDVHWSDPASVDLLTHLFAATDSMPLVLICAFRPDRDAPSTRLQAIASENYSHRCTEIRLKPLADAEINAIVDALLAIADLPAELRQNILDRAAGNPFFVEEVVRGLILSGVVVSDENNADGESRRVWRAVPGGMSMDIPDNLQGLLAARIDRLQADTRATLQLASVIGRSFYERVLTELSANANGESAHTAQHLRQLLQLQMIQEATRIPEVEYIFRNPLTQEVVYNGILLKRRREFHDRVGLAMESLFSEHLTELSPRLAYHFEQARQRAKAFHYYLMAADQARHLYANQEALAHYNQALSLIDDVETSSEQLTQLYLHRGRVLEHAGEFAEAVDNYETLGSLGREQGNKEMQLKALVASGTIHSMSDPAAAQRLAEEGLALAQELDDKAAEATVYWNLMLLAGNRSQAGDDQLAVSYGERSLALARALDLRSQMALTLNDLAAAYRGINQTGRANAAAREARELLSEMGNLPMLADAYAQSSHFLTLSGEFDEAQEAAVEAIKISAAIGNLWNQASGAASLGLIDLERGLLGSALAHLSSAANLEGIAQLDFLLSVIELRLADLFIEVGALKTARLHAEKAFPAAQGARFHNQQAAKALLARIHLLEGELVQSQKAEQELESADDAQSLFSIGFMLPVRQYQIELALARGNTESAARQAARAAALAERFGVRLQLPVFRTLLARALWQQGDEANARHALAQAEAVTRDLGARRYLWSILAQQAGWEKDEEAANQLRALARTEVSFILGNIGRSELRQSFLERQEVKQLMSGSEL